MKKLVFLLSLVLAIAVMTACSNDEMESSESSQPEYFSDSDIEELKSFNAFMESYKEDLRPTMVKAIKRNRAKTRGADELTADEEAMLREKLAEAGSRTITLCENLGMDVNELNALCSFDDYKEIYGIIGIQISDALDPTDVLPLGPDGCLAAVNWGKAAGCLADVLGINVDSLWDLGRALAVGGVAGYSTRDLLIKAIREYLENFMKKHGAKLVAGGGALAIGLYVLQWGLCYYD